MTLASKPSYFAVDILRVGLRSEDGVFFFGRADSRVVAVAGIDVGVLWQDQKTGGDALHQLLKGLR